MAKQATETAYKNPEVRYEREDIDAGGVFRSGLVLAALAAASAAFSIWLSLGFLRLPLPGSAQALPTLAGENTRPPEPRLEAIEDLEKGRHQLLPPRAREYLHPQEELLEKGGAGVIPIEQVFREMTFPSTKGKLAPMSQPNRSAAGRAVKGDE